MCGSGNDHKYTFHVRASAITIFLFIAYEEYRHGFGDVYDEYWLGLDGIRTITQKVRTNVALRIILEDWNGEIRTATYSRFYLYGKGYGISVGIYLKYYDQCDLGEFSCD